MQASSPWTIAPRRWIDPAASLFIDDSPKNVKWAIEGGWQAVLFEEAGKLEADLRRLRVVA